MLLFDICQNCAEIAPPYLTAAKQATALATAGLTVDNRENKLLAGLRYAVVVSEWAEATYNTAMSQSRKTDNPCNRGIVSSSFMLLHELNLQREMSCTHRMRLKYISSSGKLMC